MGGTGNLPVPAGNLPDEMIAALESARIAKLLCHP